MKNGSERVEKAIVASTARYFRQQKYVRRFSEIWDSTVGMIGDILKRENLTK